MLGNENTIALDTVPHEAGWVTVSTVHLAYVGGYETMVFETDESGEPFSMLELDADVYQTKEEALLGHKRMMERWANKKAA